MDNKISIILFKALIGISAGKFTNIAYDSPNKPFVPTQHNILSHSNVISLEWLRMFCKF